MIYHDVSQGSPEWHMLRMGIPTSSDFGKIITPKTMKLSAQADEYADAKIAEIMTGETQGIQVPTYHMERGTLLEAEARESYEFINNVTVERGGFITDDKGHFGCSPDFRVGNDGCGEIKCLMPKNHVTYLIKQEIAPEHKPQVFGQLHIGEFEWCDWTMYHPDLPRMDIRTYRDETYIKALADCLEQFRDIMGEKIIKLQSRGHFQIKAPIKKIPKYGPADYLMAG